MKLTESLKANNVTNDHAVYQVIVKTQERDRNVKRILYIMVEKYSRTKGDKILDLIRTICGFRTDEKVETLMDNFEKMMTEIRKLDLVRHLEYAVTLQFLDRVEKS